MAAPRTVLVTGANSGIGLATVLELARRGYDAVGSVRSEEKADVVAKAAADAGVEVRTVLLDVTDAEACERALGGLRLHGLVNNAGYGLMGAVEDIADDEARHLLETLVVGPMRLARLALPAMLEAGDGRIVNVSSIAGRLTFPYAGWYTAAKHALEAVSDALRAEVAGRGVKVVLIEPGGVKTSIWDEVEAQFATRRPSAHECGYDRVLRALRIAERLMSSSGHVARAIADVVDAPKPRARYLVGLDAQASVFADRFVPSSVQDRLARLGLGI